MTTATHCQSPSFFRLYLAGRGLNLQRRADRLWKYDRFWGERLLGKRRVLDSIKFPEAFRPLPDLLPEKLGEFGWSVLPENEALETSGVNPASGMELHFPAEH